MTLSQCIDRLAEKHGSLRAAARAAGLDVGYLSRLRSGEKHQPSDDVLAALGLERVVSYRLAKRAAKPIERTSDAATQYHMGEDCEAPT